MSAAFAAALESSIIYPIYFFEIGAADGQYLRLWTGRGERDWDGKTWAGVGWILGLSEVEETAETRATNFVIGLPANAAVISIALANFRKNRPATIWQGLLAPGVEIGVPESGDTIGEPDSSLVLGEPAGALIDDPVVIAAGLTNLTESDTNPARPTVRISCESRIADLERARVRRFTHEDHQIDWPGDLFFQYVGGLADKTVEWGKGL